MYRLIVESLLGVTLEQNCLHFTPCLPAHWTAFTMRYRYRETIYEIAFRQTLAGTGERILATIVTADGAVQADGLVHLVDDGAGHQVLVEVHAAEN
jgi:cellobiose phosphorylase